MTLKKLIAAAGLALTAALPVCATDSGAGYRFEGLTAADYHPGTSQYLVYMRDSESGTITRMELWNRTTRIIEKDGRALVETTQDWHLTGLPFNRKIYSLNALETFAPLYHRSTKGAEKPEDVQTAAYLFDEREIKGDPAVAGNIRADFTMAKQPETLNWELDMETLGLLPLELGRTFPMNFYHPGSTTGPKVYNYTVRAEETLTDLNGAPLECWIVHIDYDSGGSADFWFNKQTHAMVMMQEKFGKIRRYKIRLGVLARELPN